MGALTKVQCDGCDARADVITGQRVYVMPDGSEVQVLAALAWCSDCKAVVEADVLPHPEAVEALSLSPDALALWRMWRNGRKSASRCLACGSNKVALPADAAFLRFREDEEAAAFPHPGCGGHFRVKGVGLANVKGDPKRHSPEGLLLRSLNAR